LKKENNGSLWPGTDFYPPGQDPATQTNHTAQEEFKHGETSSHMPTTTPTTATTRSHRRDPHSHDLGHLHAHHAEELSGKKIFGSPCSTPRLPLWKSSGFASGIWPAVRRLHNLSDTLAIAWLTSPTHRPKAADTKRTYGYNGGNSFGPVNSAALLAISATL
jgi:hypothetical protein